MWKFYHPQNQGMIAFILQGEFETLSVTSKPVVLLTCKKSSYNVQAGVLSP